jgi:glutamate N-acetyltransferase/amino-acid N-acetyltransferase
MSAESSPVSPLAPANFPTLNAVAGVEVATFAAGLRYQKRADLMLATMAPGTVGAGTFTRSRCASAPVDWCREILGSGEARAVVCNAGNANAFTGRAGATAAAQTAETIAAELGIDPRSVYLASTGVIGESLPMDAMKAGLRQLAGNLGATNPQRWEAAAHAIRTTDTFAKGAGASVAIGDAAVTISGIAKGSGMIAPDMATMLCFIFTDAALSQSVAQALVSEAVNLSFNRITVDSDTSTSDTVLLFCTGQAEGTVLIEDVNDPRLDDFKAALRGVALDLAHQIVRDGEGATKFVAVRVEGAESDESAGRIALSIANSPLVKTMLAAADANWGRVVMAVGKAGEPADRDRLAIWMGDEQAAIDGEQAPGYSEERATEHLKGDEVTLRAHVGVGDGAATVWTCDLTHGYIDINASYRS